MSTEALQLKVDELNQMSLTKMVEDIRVRSRFVSLYNKIHGDVSGELIYEKEKFNFLRKVSESVELNNCSRLSLYGAFLDLSVNGLSLDQGSKPLAYLMSRSVKTGMKDQQGRDIYEKRAYLEASPYGELVMRMRAGQVRHVDNPVILYEGDIFEPELLPGGQKTARYKPAIPRKSNKIIGAFICITRNDGTTDLQWMLEDDIKRLQGWSERNNSKWVEENGKKVKKDGPPNALYTSNKGQIDTGFLEAKMIKHGFDSYPKVRTGAFTELATAQLEPKPEEIDYGINEEGKAEPEMVFAAAPMDNQTEPAVTVKDEDEVF